MVDIVIPDDLWDDDKEGVMLTWVYTNGTHVQEGKLLAELSVEKAQLEVVSPATGRLTILAPPETIVRRGAVIGRVDPA